MSNFFVEDLERFQIVIAVIAVYRDRNRYGNSQNI